MDETVEEDVVEEIKEQVIEKPVKEETQSIFEGTETNGSLKFNDVDKAMGNNGTEEEINAHKTIERLEDISALRNMQRKMEEEEEDTFNTEFSYDRRAACNSPLLLLLLLLPLCVSVCLL